MSLVVLVVEDSLAMRLVISHSLHKIEGVEIVEATDGMDALAKIATRRPDVIVTDINMPVMDGFTMIEQVRARPDLHDIPVIVLTTAGATVDKTRARALEVAAYATKPVHSEEIVATVLRVVEERALGR